MMQQAGPPFSQFSDKACVIALESATYCSGILGATGGQFLDLFPPNQSLETVKQVIYKKTVTFFEASFILGWVFGGGDVSKLERVRKAAYHFGMAFQTADDLGDMVQDEKKQREISVARLIGKERALLYFDEEMRHLQRLLEELKLFTPSFEKMCQILIKYAVNNAQAIN